MFTWAWAWTYIFEECWIAIFRFFFWLEMCSLGLDGICRHQILPRPWTGNSSPIRVVIYKHIGSIMHAYHPANNAMELLAYYFNKWNDTYIQLCESSSYGKAVDVWSVGCIFAELFLKKPFLCGDNPRHQLETIVHRSGHPTYIQSIMMRSYPSHNTHKQHS